MSETVVTISEPVEIVLIEDGGLPEVVVLTEETFQVIEIAEQGLPGAPGAPGAPPTEQQLVNLITPLIEARGEIDGGNF